MKKLIIIFCTLFSTALMAQPAPKDANEIVIHTSLEYEEAYDMVMKDLLRRGYSLDKVDPENGTIQTFPFSVRWGFIDADIMDVSFNCQFNKLDNGTEVVITGDIGLGSGELSYPSLPISNTGKENSATFTSWQMMKELAEGLPSENISYRTTPKFYTAR